MNLDSNKADSPFHEGEKEVQTRMGVRDKIENVGRQMIKKYLPSQHQKFYSLLPFIIVGMTDEEGNPWASILTGKPGFITSTSPDRLYIKTKPLFGSPMALQLHIGVDIGILGILPENRRRNRCSGTIIAIDENGITVKVSQTFGNCPQYIQTREIEILSEQINQPQQEKTIVNGSLLDEKAKSLIQQADTFFIATAYNNEQSSFTSQDNPAFGADASHRGGKPGFVKVENDRTFIFPDFTGNFIFNTVGNILVNPKAGFLFIDFDSRDLLYLTGNAEIIWQSDEVENFLGADRFIRFQVKQWRRVGASLPLKFEFGEYSPLLQSTGSWEEMKLNLSADKLD